MSQHGLTSQHGPHGSRRRPVVAVLAVVVLVVALAAGAGSYLLLRTKGSPRQTAASYLQSWQQRSYAAMDQVSVNVPGSGLAGPLGRAAAQLGQRRLHLVLGQVTTSGGSALARFTATAQLASGHTWTYPGRLRLVTPCWLIGRSPVQPIADGLTGQP
jgi:hypothetical protein